MSVSFIRVDDRMIHGQTCTRWHWSILVMESLQSMMQLQ